MTKKLTTAISEFLKDLNQPVVSDYLLFLCAHNFYLSGEYKGENLYIRKKEMSYNRGLEVIGELHSQNIIRHDTDFDSSGIYRVVNVNDAPAEEICGLVDPFCYISHLSAMSRYGITNRMSASVFISSPYRPLWKELRDKKYSEDYPVAVFTDQRLSLRKIAFPDKVRKMPISFHETRYPSQSMAIRDSFARISNIGSTFLDMLEKPSFCGGMSHVLEVWEEYAQTYLEDIISSVNLAQKKIIKVRAGYIMEEMLKIKDERILLWLNDAQRGGSRVLDPESPFSSTFSEKWMLSINV